MIWHIVILQNLPWAVLHWKYYSKTKCFYEKITGKSFFISKTIKSQELNVLISQKTISQKKT